LKSNYIDIYCERTGPEFWSEPVNALTNIAFILSSLFLSVYLIKKKSKKFDLVNWIFIFLIFLIGLGSWSFHTFANTVSLLSDIIPIGIFIVLYTWFTFQRLVYINWYFPYVAVLSILILSFLLSFIPLYGSQSYLGALIFLFLVGIYCKIYRNLKFSSSLIFASFILLVSIIFRTTDMYICKNFFVGSHFIWHILNSILLFIVTKVMIDYGRKKSN
tara:strand:- start:23 stop:673 length:651 start_codon:yes stop_codon:yes gene_type:complete